GLELGRTTRRLASRLRSGRPRRCEGQTPHKNCMEEVVEVGAPARPVSPFRRGANRDEGGQVGEGAQNIICTQSSLRRCSERQIRYASSVSVAAAYSALYRGDLAS